MCTIKLNDKIYVEYITVGEVFLNSVRVRHSDTIERNPFENGWTSPSTS